MDCLQFIGNPFYLAYLVDENRTYPDCEYFLYDERPVATETVIPSGGGDGTGTTTTIVVREVQPPFDPSTIDPNVATQAFLSGWGIVMVTFLATYVVRSLVSMIRN